jgi:cytochrome c-type biogenesis protein CcmH/NrfG
MGEVEAARFCFLTALTLDPNHAKSLLMLGRLYRRREELYDDALAEARPLEISCLEF